MAEERAPLTTPAATLVYTVSSESWVCGEKEGGERGEGKEEREERRKGDNLTTVAYWQVCISLHC